MKAFAWSTPVLAAAICLLLVARSAGAQDTAGMVVIPANARNLTYFGRWDRRDPTVAHSHWGGAYLRTRFTGASVGLKMLDGESLVVSIDGEPFRAVKGVAGITPLNMEPLAPGLHTLLVGSSSGGEAKVLGLSLDPRATTKPAIPRPIVEFIGDSITWGTGPEGMWNVNWTWQTAEALNCDHTQIAQSARALTTGYGCADEKTGMDKQYFMLKNFGYVNEVPPVPWNFATYTPQIIVINLGQNDACGNEPDDVFTNIYISFVKNIRTRFPVAQIVALRMFGGGHFGVDTRKAVAALNAGGDDRVHFIDTEGWLNNPSDFSDGVHPNAQGNLKAAMRLAPLLEPLLPAKDRAAAGPATVGDPQNPTGLAQALQNAYVRGDHPIVITRGTYYLTHTGDSNLPLRQWHDATISAYGVTLILNNLRSNAGLFLLDGCANVTIEGPLLSETGQNAYQGHVIAIGADEDGTPSFDWRPSAGYPVPPGPLRDFWINFVDARTRTINLQAGDYYHTRLEPLGNGLYRIHLNERRPVRFSVGDWMVSRYDDPPVKIRLTGSHNCTIKDVTMMRNGFAPIFDGEGGGNHYLRCHWALGPRPQGATEDPIVTNSADGIHSPDDSVGPDIEDCTFEGVFLDDCIAIHGGYHRIVKADGPTIVAQNAYAFYKVGEPVRISDDHGFYLQAKVTALKDNGDGTSTLTLDTAATIPTDASMSKPLADGAGYKIIGCHLGNTRSRGIIVKSDDGVIENNVVSHSGLAIRIGPEWPSEADYSQNVIVKGNTLTQNGDGIVIDGSGVKQNRNITIKHNQFVANYGSDLSVAWADGVTIIGNSFVAPAARAFGEKPRPPILVRDSSNITINGNQFKADDAYARPFVNIGDNTEGVEQSASASR